MLLHHLMPHNSIIHVCLILEKQPAGHTLQWKLQIQRRVLTSPGNSICSSVQWPAACETNLTIKPFSLQSSEFRDSCNSVIADKTRISQSWHERGRQAVSKLTFPWLLFSFRRNVHKSWLWFHKNTLRPINLVIQLQRSIRAPTMSLLKR